METPWAARVTRCFLLLRVVCVIPPVVAAPPSLWVARPPSLYSHRLRILRHCLREHTAPYAQQLRRMTALRSLRFPELRLVQFDSGTAGFPSALALRWACLALGYEKPDVVPSIGKLEALAILLQKLKSEGRRVLILSQMVLMLDILEMFLNFHYLTYIRIDENANSEQRQVRKRGFALVPWTVRCCSHVSALSALASQSRVSAGLCSALPNEGSGCSTSLGSNRSAACASCDGATCGHGGRVGALQARPGGESVGAAPTRHVARNAGHMACPPSLVRLAKVCRLGQHREMGDLPPSRPAQSRTAFSEPGGRCGAPPLPPGAAHTCSRMVGHWVVRAPCCWAAPS